MKITLATLPQATEQQVFDQVAKHLLTQNEKSMHPKSKLCLYRTSGGLKCAAGALISDEEYSPLMEMGSWRTLIRRHGVSKHCAALISDLQYLHDGYTVSEWRDGLRRLARQYNLNEDVCNEA